MRPGSEAGFSVYPDIPCAFLADETASVFSCTPGALPAHTRFVVALDSQRMDARGNHLAAHAFSFSTGASDDRTRRSEARTVGSGAKDPAGNALVAAVAGSYQVVVPPAPSTPGAAVAAPLIEPDATSSPARFCARGTRCTERGWDARGACTGHATVSFVDAPLLDAFPPPEVARRVAALGARKARFGAVTTLLLSGLAGAFISLGALLYAVTITGSTLGFGPTRLLGGAAFSLGLVLVIVAGAELFTGNNLVVMAWASRLVTLRELARNWLLVLIGNAVGALATAGLVLAAGTHRLADGAVGKTLLAIGQAKAALPPGELLARGVLCNALVCLAVWLTQAGRSVTDKVVGIAFPITAFVAMGFEHSIANLFFLPVALALGDVPAGGVAANLVLVTVGNVLGGSVLVAGVYWVAYLREGSLRETPAHPEKTDV